MARMVNWNTAAFEAECINVGMDRLEAGAGAIRDKAQDILKSKLKGDVHRPVYRKGPHKGQVYTERNAGDMVNTIRVVRKKDSSAREVRVYAGNFKTWWALQLEYGRGGWKGGASPFIRPAMRGAAAAFKAIFESGNGETK
jgi:hypothetical protein